MWGLPSFHLLRITKPTSGLSDGESPEHKKQKTTPAAPSTPWPAYTAEAQAKAGLCANSILEVQRNAQYALQHEAEWVGLVGKRPPPGCPGDTPEMFEQLKVNVSTKLNATFRPNFQVDFDLLSKSAYGQYLTPPKSDPTKGGAAWVYTNPEYAVGKEKIQMFKSTVSLDGYTDRTRMQRVYEHLMPIMWAHKLTNSKKIDMLFKTPDKGTVPYQPGPSYGEYGRWGDVTIVEPEPDEFSKIPIGLPKERGECNALWD